jgi:hypothetical protein
MKWIRNFIANLNFPSLSFPSARIVHFGSCRHFLRIAALAALIVTSACHRSWAQTTSSHSKTPHESLAKLAERHFADWDRDHNNVLELLEIDRAIEDHSVQGRHAALVVCLRYHMTGKGHQPSLAHPQLLHLLQEEAFQKEVERTTKHLETIDRELFLTTDPNLATFNQGRLNDCYLLSVIAAQTHRNPHSIREMIHPQVTGGFHVVFGDGQKIHVSSLTDGELLLGARLDNRHGSWLAVLEKSYGIIRKRDHAKKNGQGDLATGPIAVETLNFGNSGSIISLLTGHHTESVKLGTHSHSDQIHSLLTTTTAKRHLVCTSTNHDKPPPGMGTNHVYAILGYDAHQRHVKIFNPWGNNFTPKGPPGQTHGYETKNGFFTVPLDQFHIVFASVVYETERPLAKK